MNIQITNPEAVQEFRWQLERLAATQWMKRYGERFPAQWEVTSVNVVGPMLDITFSWIE